MILLLSTRISIRILIYDFGIIYADFYQDLDLWFCYYIFWFLSGSWFKILLWSILIYISILSYDFAIIYADLYQDLDLWFCYYLLWFLLGSWLGFLSVSWFRILLLSTRISIRILIWDFAIIYEDFYNDLALWFFYYIPGFLSGSWFTKLLLSTRIYIRILI